MKIGDVSVDVYKCDKCGKIFQVRQQLQGISHRCVERVWDICDDCLTKFHNFMENDNAKQ